MTLSPQRIEAAARALCHEGVTVSGVWRCQRDTAACRDCWDEAAAVLTAAFPELADGTAWLAPMEATDAMWEVDYREHDGLTTFPAQHWEKLRDAFLNKDTRDADAAV